MGCAGRDMGGGGDSMTVGPGLREDGLGWVCDLSLSGWLAVMGGVWEDCGDGGGGRGEGKGRGRRRGGGGSLVCCSIYNLWSSGKGTRFEYEEKQE